MQADEVTRDARITKALREHPDAMIMELARQHAVSERHVLALLGPPRAVVLDIARWEELLRGLPSLGRVRVIASNSGITMETRGTFGGFSLVEGWFNVQTATLDLHLRTAALGSAIAVEKPSHQSGRPTASVQLFDLAGHAIMKVFLLFGEDDDGADGRRQAFEHLRDQFATN
jgi:putative heme iron utilization protein